MKEYKSINRIHFNLVSGILLGLLFIYLALSLTRYFIGGNPIDEYLLIKYGVVTKGFITEANEDLEMGDNGQILADFYYSYTFLTVDGKKIESHGSLGGRIPEYLDGLYEPYPVEIEYLPNKPTVNRVKSFGYQTLTGWFLRMILLGAIVLLISCSFGIRYIFQVIKGYKKDKHDYYKENADLMYSFAYEKLNYGDYQTALLYFDIAIKYEQKRVDYSEVLEQSYEGRSKAKEALGDVDGSKRDLAVIKLYKDAWIIRNNVFNKQEQKKFKKIQSMIENSTKESK